MTRFFCIRFSFSIYDTQYTSRQWQWCISFLIGCTHTLSQKATRCVIETPAVTSTCVCGFQLWLLGAIPTTLLHVPTTVCFQRALFSKARGRIHSTRLTANPCLYKHCLCLSQVLTKRITGPSSRAKMYCFAIFVIEELQNRFRNFYFSFFLVMPKVFIEFYRRVNTNVHYVHNVCVHINFYSLNCLKLDSCLHKAKIRCWCVL